MDVDYEWWAFETIDCDVHEIILLKESDEFELGQCNFLLESRGIQSFLFLFSSYLACIFFIVSDSMCLCGAKQNEVKWSAV